MKTNHLAPSRERIKVLGLSLYGQLAASTRHRLTQFVPELGERGVDVNVQPLLGDDYLRRRFDRGEIGVREVARGLARRFAQLWRQGDYDCAWVQGELLPMAPGWLETALLRIPYVYDFDDAFFLKYQLGAKRVLRPVLGRKFERIIGGAAAVFPGNATLRAYAAPFNDHCVVVPTVVDHRRYRVRAAREAGGVFNVGWIGSPSSIRCLTVLAEPLAKLAQEGPVRLSVVGGVAPPIVGVEVVNIPWSEATEVAEICKFDAGVMPLEDEPWTRGKCAFKLIQYMACAVPVVGSPVGANTEVVTPACGFLATTAEEWLTALRYIRDNPQASDRMGAEGRERVVRNYSLTSQLPVIESGLRRVARHRS